MSEAFGVFVSGDTEVAGDGTHLYRVVYTLSVLGSQVSQLQIIIPVGLTERQFNEHVSGSLIEAAGLAGFTVARHELFFQSVTRG